MKIIELLNKISNGEEVPKKIHYNCVPLYWCEPCKIYETMTDGELCGKDLYTLIDNLNDEVEIIEEEKKTPEKLSTWFSVETKQSDEENVEYANYNFETMYEKINEICDYLDYLKSKGDE